MPFSFYFRTPQQVAELYADELGASVPMIAGPETGVNRHSLFKEAKTLRERLFSRLMISVTRGTAGEFCVVFAPHWGEKFELNEPKSWTLRGVMAAAKRSPSARRPLTAVPFVTGPISTYADVELPEYLQDLADIIAWEATAAHKDKFYPGIVGIEPLSVEHIEQVAEATQREMDREGPSPMRKKVAWAKMTKLTFERKRAFAERRRYWYGQFGITPKTYGTQVLSLWKVSNALPPVGPKYLASP